MNELPPPCSLPLRLRAWIRRSTTAIVPRTGDHDRCRAEAAAHQSHRRLCRGRCLSCSMRPRPLLVGAAACTGAEAVASPAARRPGSLPLLAGDEAKVAAAPSMGSCKGGKGSG
uniref:Uncharacterized protein n=1 Tax=Oryza punctata TaxID=4537 RepID=A0A0E0JRB2_ORYPU